MSLSLRSINLLFSIGFIICFSRLYAVQYEVTVLPSGSYSNARAFALGDGFQAGFVSNNQGGAISVVWGIGSPYTPLTSASYFDYVSAQCAYGSKMAGFGYVFYPPTGNVKSHAALWDNPNSTPIDLNPVGSIASNIFALDNNSQVGFINAPTSPGNSNAVLWSSSASSAVDLHNSMFDTTFAYGVRGIEAVTTVTPTANSVKWLWYDAH